MAKAAKGQYFLKNPEKYLGNNKNEITYRSSWELTMMNYLDAHPMVLGWMSESLPTNTVHKGISGIPYRNPVSGKWTIYVPDFFVIYIDKNNKQHAEVIEIKPLDDTPWYRINESNNTKANVSAKKQLVRAINAAKFKAAAEFCAARGWKFRIATENELFKRPAI